MNKLLSIIRRWLRKETVDHVISDFNTQIKRLEDIATRESDRAEKHTAAIEKIAKKKAQSLEHSMRALNVSEKFKALIS